MVQTGHLALSEKVLANTACISICKLANQKPRVIGAIDIVDSCKLAALKNEGSWSCKHDLDKPIDYALVQQSFMSTATLPSKERARFSKMVLCHLKAHPA